MIEGGVYIEKVKEYFNFLIVEFGFSILEEIVNGNYFYKLRYISNGKAVTISYENIEDYFSVFISMLEDGKMPDYDDKAKTLHLDKLNSSIIPSIGKDEIAKNNEVFLGLVANGSLERRLLKSAKDLRLCLRHFKTSLV